jgi:hypothetical protein
MSQTYPARQVPGHIPQGLSMVVDRTDNRHKRFKELTEYLRTIRTTIHSTQTSDTVWGTNKMGRHNSIHKGEAR